jgi:glutathione-dependent formaldehyde-activating enzyme
MATFRGSCLCGEVAFEVEGPFDRFLNCHCSRCRKATGTAHSGEVIVQAAALRWLRGEASVARYDLPTALCNRLLQDLAGDGLEHRIPCDLSRKEEDTRHLMRRRVTTTSFAHQRLSRIRSIIARNPAGTC